MFNWFKKLFRRKPQVTLSLDENGCLVFSTLPSAIRFQLADGSRIELTAEKFAVISGDGKEPLNAKFRVDPKMMQYVP
jgi:hypothetical protein